MKRIFRAFTDAGTVYAIMYYVKNAWSHIKKQEYNGSRYDSRFEANYAAELDLRKKAGEIKDWQRQVKIPLDVNGYHISNYYIDFVVYHSDGIVEYVELKGRKTDIWILKWKLFEALYSEKPDVVLTVVMQGKGKPPKARKIKKPL